MSFGIFLILVVAPLVMSPLTAYGYPDPKLLPVAVGTAAIWFSAMPNKEDRALRLVLLAWIAATALTALLGVDPIRSILGTETVRVGVLIVGIWGFLIYALRSTPPAIVARIPVWLAYAGAVGAVQVTLGRLVPQLLPTALTVTTLGNPVYLEAYLAAALAAVIGMHHTPWPRRYLLVAIVGIGMGAAQQRFAYVLPILVMGSAATFRLLPVKRAALTGALVVGCAAAAWSVASLVPHPFAGASGGPVAELSGNSVSGDVSRFHLQDAVAAVAQRPISGWGAGQYPAAYLHVSDGSVIQAARSEMSSHDLFIDSAVDGGLLVSIALLAMVVVLVIRLRRAPKSWATVAAVALGAWSLVQPRHVAITTVLFAVIGLALVEPLPEGRREREDHERWLRDRYVAGPGTAVVGVSLVIGAFLATLAFTAGTTEEIARATHSIEGLRMSLRLEPWRTPVRMLLAEQLAQEPSTVGQAQAMIDREIRLHPWNTDVRIVAAVIALKADDSAAAASYLDDHLRRFPGDAGVVDAVMTPRFEEAAQPAGPTVPTPAVPTTAAPPVVVPAP